MSTLRRLAKIISVIARHRLDLLIDWHTLPGPARWLLRFSPMRLVPDPKTDRAVRLRETLEDLGPVFIKFGQALSTRRDLLPPDIADELAKLQDEVPPFDPSQAINIIEKALGQSVDQLFAEFNAEPLASASIAQVHSARLHSGEDVVVKVVRPGIDQIIEQDLSVMLTMAKLLVRYVPEGRRLRPVEVVSDYRHTILDELDLKREGANTSQLRRNFEESDMLYVPEVHWDYTRRNVLVMEKISGIPVSNVDELIAQNTDMKLLAERGVEIFFTQVFRDNFFHADMHPGNVFVSREHPDQPMYIGIDCAIMGSLSDFDRYYLARNLLAMFDRDYRSVAELHVECGWVPPQTRVQDFEAAMRSTCEPVFEKPLGEISFGQLLIYLFQTASRFDMEIQPSLVLLQKTLLNIEGLGRQLYPQLDLWQTAKPFLEEWMRERYAPVGMLEQILHRAPQWLEQVPQLPELVLDSLNQSQALPELVAKQQEQIEQLSRDVRRDKGRRRKLALAIACAVAAVWIAQPDTLTTLADIPLSSAALAGLALVLALRA